MKKVDQAFFLKRIPFGDSSTIVTLFTRTYGKQTFMFQGGKKKGSNSYPLQQIELEYYKRPESELGKISKLALLDQSLTLQLQQEPIRALVVMFMAEVLLQCLKPNHPDEEMFDYVQDELITLLTTSELQVIPILFLVHVSDHMGILPAIEEQNKLVFHLDEGEFSNASRQGLHERMGEAVDLIQDLIRGGDPLKNPSRAVYRDALSIMLDFFTLHIPNFDVSRSISIIQEVLD